jgi:hypothetical protein
MIWKISDRRFSRPSVRLSPSLPPPCDGGGEDKD